MTRTERLVGQFRRERGWTRQLVAAVPEEHFHWAPAPDAFSCGGLVAHLILAEVFWRRLLSAAARGEAYDPFGLSGNLSERYEAFRPRNFESTRSGRFGGTFAEVLGAWMPIEEQTARELGAIEEDRLTRSAHHPVTGFTATVEDMFFIFFSHESHHRGQLSAYLKMLGCPQPPLFTEGA